MRARAVSVSVAAALTLGAGLCRAVEPCLESWEAASGPLPGGNGPADFGAIPEACAGSDATLRARGALLAAPSMPDYYGNVNADAMLRVRRPLSARSWLTLALDFVDFRYVDNGGLAATALSIGPPTIAYLRTISASPTTTTAAYARLLLPLDTARQNGVETGLELGGSFRRRVRTWVILDGGVALTAPLDITAGQLHGRLDPVALAEAWFPLGPAVALLAGGALELELAPGFALTTLVPRAGARFALRHRISLAILVELPVVGTDRTDLVASLFGGVAL